MNALSRKSLGALLLLATAASANAKGCDAACLKSVISNYYAALEQRDAKKLPLASKVKFTENGKVLALTDGVFKVATKVGNYREVFVDASTGNALVIAVIDEGPAQAIIATRLKAADGKVTEIETVAARKGSHPLSRPNSSKKPIRCSSRKSIPILACRKLA